MTRIHKQILLHNVKCNDALLQQIQYKQHRFEGSCLQQSDCNTLLVSRCSSPHSPFTRILVLLQGWAGLIDCLFLNHPRNNLPQCVFYSPKDRSPHTRLLPSAWTSGKPSKEKVPTCSFNITRVICIDDGQSSWLHPQGQPQWVPLGSNAAHYQLVQFVKWGGGGEVEGSLRRTWTGEGKSLGYKNVIARCVYT